MKRLIIAAVGLALVVGIIIGGIVGDTFGRSSASAATAGGRLISLGTQTLSPCQQYVSPLAAVSDCSQLVVMAVTSNPNLGVTLEGSAATSPDGTIRITTSEAVTEINGGYGRILKPYPYVSVNLDVACGVGTTNVTGWLWCATSASNTVGGIAEVPDAETTRTGAGMGGGTFAVLGAVGGVLAITVAGTVAAKRRGGQ